MTKRKIKTQGRLYRDVIGEVLSNVTECCKHLANISKPYVDVKATSFEFTLTNRQKIGCKIYNIKVTGIEATEDSTNLHIETNFSCEEGGILASSSIFTKQKNAYLDKFIVHIVQKMYLSMLDLVIATK